MSKGKRYAIGRELTSFGDALSKSEFDNPSGAGEWKKLDNAFLVGLSAGNKELMEEAQEYMENVRDLVINNFDFIITSVALFRDFYSLIFNFMNAVANYIADLVYNALDSYLRLGVHLLVIPPNLTDWGFNGLPTTSLEKQAEIAYKKFYDTSDSNIPYYLPYKTDVAEDIIQSGKKIQKTLENFYRISEDEDKPKQFDSDFITFEKSVENLSRPLGLYEAIFLYFSVDYRSNAKSILRYVQSIATLSNLFQLESLNGVYDDVNGLFKPKIKKVKILSNVSLTGIDVSKKSSSTNYKKIDEYTIKRYPEDPNLNDIYIVPADPVANMPAERKERLEKHLKDQGYIDNQNLDILKNLDMSDSRFSSVYDFNISDNIEYKRTQEDIRELRSEIVYYGIQNGIASVLNADITNVDTFNDNLTTYTSSFENLLFTYGNPDLSNLYTSSKWNTLTTLISNINTFQDEYQNYKNQVEFLENESVYAQEILKYTSLLNSTQKQIDNYLECRSVKEAAGLDPDLGCFIKNEVYDHTTGFSRLKAEYTSEIDKNELLLQEELNSDRSVIDGMINDIVAAGNVIRNENLELIDKFTITPPDIQNAERIEILKEKEDDIIKLESEILTLTKEQFRESANNIIESIEYKKNQLDILKVKSSAVSTEGNSANVIFYHSSYPIVNQTSLYKNYIQQVYNFDATIESQNYIHEFTIKVEPFGSRINSAPDLYNADKYVHIVKYNGTEYDILGDGIIISDINQPFVDGNVRGNWAKLNFSDMIGTTPLIKDIQNKVLKIANIFEPETVFFDLMIKRLKELKSSLLSLIEAIESLIEILSLSIEFEGVIYGKYCRETGFEGYDKLASDLTNTDSYSKVPRINFRPSDVSSINTLLSRMRQIDPVETENFKKTINSLFAQTTNHDDKNKQIEDNAQIQVGNTDRVSEAQAAAALGASIQEKIDSLSDLPSNILNIGSSLYANVTDIGVVPKEEYEKNQDDNSIKMYKSQIWQEISKIEKKLSSEFGFSLILLSYLPKGMNVYPIRFIADALGLIDEEGDAVTQEGLTPLDEQTILDLLPNKTLQDLENDLSQLSEDTNPSVAIKAEPIPYTISFIPFRTTESFELNDSKTLALSNDPNYFTGTLNAGNYEFKLFGKLNNNYLHGVTSTSAMELVRYSNLITNDFTYRYEFELGVTYDSTQAGTNDIVPEINKINVYMGVFFEGRENAFRYAKQLNGDASEVFKFGRRKKKKFIGEIVIGQEESYVLKPYILIGYDNGDLDMQKLTFTITSSQIFFYRIK